MAARVFYSYSHEDKRFRDELEKHLAPLIHEGLMEPWYDREIPAGADFEAEIDSHLDQADIALLLVSASFLHSRYCYGIEMRRALAREQAGTLIVVPVIVRPCYWTITPLARLSAVPRDGEAITTWANHDLAYVDIAHRLRELIQRSPNLRNVANPRFDAGRAPLNARLSGPAPIGHDGAPALRVVPVETRADRARHTFEEAAQRYKEERRRRSRLDPQEVVWLDEVMPYIGHLPLDEVDDVPLQSFVMAQRSKVLKGGKVGVKSNTLNLKLGLVIKVLRLARHWLDEGGRPWLRGVPPIKKIKEDDQRVRRVLTWEEQREQVPKLPTHLARMALFMLQCGVRDEFVCSLRWKWEVKFEELDIVTFVVPVKGRTGLLVCNSAARQIIESARGQHPEYVFVYKHGRRERSAPRSVQTMNNTAWQNWRLRCGFGDLQVEDLRHTVRTRLREAGVTEETRAEILWLAERPQTQYTPAYVLRLFEALEKIRDPEFPLPSKPVVGSSVPATELVM